VVPGGPGDWQFEADLLAEGRQALERFSRSRRYRYLYPEGPSLALLLMAYQELDRQRAVGRVRGGLRRQARALRRILLQVAREDAIGRTRRLQYRYPPPRAHQILAPPDLVRRALGKVDADARRLVETRLFGQRAVPDPSVSMASESARENRGMAQFRDALVNEALASPAALVRLHPQYLLFAASPPPARRHHPIATFLLVKLPLQLIGALLTLLVVGYVGAWAVFNDEVLGDFVSDRVSGLVEGELRMGSIHWDLPLVYDLVTGRPSHVVVEDVTVWEPYESYGGERLRRAAHADRLEVKLVLHEIIPWNRLGIPRALDIPWVLHFTDVQTDDAAWFTVRQYVATDDEGVEHRLIGLRDAFLPVAPTDPNRRGLSFAVDQARLSRVELDLDFEDTAEWRTQLVLDWANFGLRFDAPPAGSPGALELPLVVWLEALGRHGAVRIKGLEVPLSDLEITRFASGLGGTRRADVALSATVSAAGSPLTLHGVLGRALARDEPTDPFGDLTTVQLSAATPDGGPLVKQILREMQLPPGAFVADGAPVTATIEGPLADPRYELAVQGAAIDPLDEPAWTATDVTLSAVIEPGEVPERFVDPDDPAGPLHRRIVTLDTLRGDALHGAFQLHRDAPATIVIPEDEGEPWRMAFDLALDSIDPAQLMPEDPEAALVLGGQAGGHLDVRRLVLAPSTESEPPMEPASEETSALQLAELVLEDIALVRDRGPADDGLPQRIEAEGRVLIDETGAIDLSELRLSTDGGFVEVDGGVEGDLERMKETLLRLRVDRGPAFSRALGIDDYFDTLRADITVHGPLFAPSSKPGTLHVTGVGDPGAPPTDATIRLDKGTLFVRTDNAHLFGSTGRVDGQVVLFAGGELLPEPRVKADVALAGVRIEELLGEDSGVSGVVDVEVAIDDGQGRPAPIDRLTIAGKARAAKLRFGGTLYRDAVIEFTLLPDSLRIDRLVLPIHRPVSPLSAPDVTVPIGELVASGTVGLRRDPSLDLSVQARGVPVGVVARLLDLDVPMRGQIAEGTDLRVGGTAARPKVEGTVRLEGLSSSGLLLGSGQLEVTSADFGRDGPLAAHRELRARGELSTPERERGRLEWTIDAVVAIGEARGGTRPAIDAEVDVAFDRLSISTLLAAADPTAPDPVVSGRLEGVGGHVLACNDGAPMLSACMDASARPALAVDLQVDRAWISGEALPESTADPCAQVTTLCSEDRLEARLDWPLVELARPWTLRMGDDGAATLQVTGGLDLSSEDAKEAQRAGPPGAIEVKCRPPALTGSPGPSGRTPRRVADGSSGPRAEVRGVVDLRALAPLLGDAGITIERGRLDVDLSIAGRLGDPRVSGRVTLAEAEPSAKPTTPASGAVGDPIVLSVPGVTMPLEIRDLDLRVVGDWLAAAGSLAVGGEELDFGSVRGENTGLALAGPCAGRFAGAGEGAISAALINALAGRTIAPKGSVDITRLGVAGSTESGLQRGEASLRFGSRALELEITEGLEDLEITGGQVDVALCTAESCPAMPEGTIAVHFAGADAADDRDRPANALAARVGPRGRAFAWGSAYLAPDLSHFEGSDVVVQLVDVPYRDYDSRGRPVFELEASSDAVELQGGDPLVVSGAIDLGRARYVKDAIEGVNLLAFTDSVDVPEAAPPEIMRTVQLDLRVQTESLARIENNIAHRVEARLALDVTGTYEHPELTGRIDIEPGGTVDIPFVTGTYEIQRGRVDLVGDLGDAEVDVLALRLEPIYVEGSARRISLLLGGTVSAITWDCIVAGDTTGAAETQRGCLDYLVLGAGDVALDSDVQRLGGGGLTNARKPLQVVGHVTEFDFGKRIEDAAPRYRSYVPNIKARLGQIGPELVVASPEEWLDFDYGHATFGWHYTRGYPGFLLRQSRELTLRLEILDPVSVEYSRDNRDYLNERIVFDPLQQRTIELRFDFEIPSLR
jgi:hypothetical protein